MLAIMDAYKSGLLRSSNWLPNIIAGLIVGVVALPLAMAFAIASGVKPEQGLYTAIIAAFIVAVCGGSRVQIAGPTGAFVVILSSITAKYGIDGLQTATLIAGCILIVMGLIKLGNVIKYIPDPVIVGFTAGIGCIIFVGEWKDFFGLSMHLATSAPFYEKLFAAFQALPYLNLTTTTLAIFSLGLMLITPKISKRLPGPLVAMLVLTSMQMLFHFKQVATIGTMFGGIPQQLPILQFPSLHLSRILELIGSGFTIALLGAIESLLSATAADGMAGTHHHSNQELIGQGIANIIAPLFGGFAATGAIARTATNVRNGGNCAISAVFHSVFLLLVIVFLAPLAIYIPLCTLAAILFVVAYNMSDLPHVIHMIKCAPRTDVFILLATFFLTVFTDLVVAVNVGVILAMLFFIRRMNETINIEEQSNEKLQSEFGDNQSINIPNETIVYTIQGPFFFGVAEKIEHTLAIANIDPKIIVFRLKDVPFMDMTGLETFKELIQQYRQRDIKIYICEANARVQEKLQHVGILNMIEEKCVYNTVVQALKTVQSSHEKILRLNLQSQF